MLYNIYFILISVQYSYVNEVLLSRLTISFILIIRILYRISVNEIILSIKRCVINDIAANKTGK